MIVETTTAGSRATETLHVSPTVEIGTLRELLVALVRHEVAAYARRREASRALRVLTPADLARGAATGVVGREARAVPAPPDEAEAVARALEAFTDGLVLVLVDGTPVEDLDAPVTVRADSTVRLVRLVALTGG